MEQHAGVYHTKPRLVYLPTQPALDSLNEEYGNDLYLFEQRLSGDWSDADNLGISVILSARMKWWTNSSTII